MRYHTCSSLFSFFLVNCGLLFLLAACTPVAPGEYHASVPSRPASTSVTAVARPPLTKPGHKVAQASTLQTDCPSNGFARPAVLKPFVPGTHPTLMYSSNDVSQDGSTSTGVLKRYDTISQHTSVLATSGRSISNAQVSADGQWMLFLSQGNGSKGSASSRVDARLQLIRVDGADLQTLYCASASVTISGVHWSENQKFVLLDILDSSANMSTILLLNIANGTLRTELQAPLGSNNYKTMIWLDSTHVYITRRLSQSQSMARPALYLLDVVHNKDIQGSSLKKVSDFPGSGGAMHLESSADKSLDAKTLFLSYCFPSGTTLVSNITSQSATGGSQQDIYRNVQGCIKDLRVIAKTKLLFTVRLSDNGSAREVLMLAHTDGAGPTILYKSSNPHVTLQLNRYAPLPWSNISRDGALYAFSEQGAMVGVSRLLIGSFPSGKITPLISNPSGTVSVAGWTTM